MSRPRVTHVVATAAFAGVERYVCDTAGELHRRGWDVTVVGGETLAMRTNLPATVMHIPAQSPIEVARTLWRHPTDLVHAHMTSAEAGAALLKGRRYDRLVSTRHFAQPRGSSALGRLARPMIERRLDAEIAISDFVATAIGGGAVVVPNGVPDSGLAPRPRNRSVVMMQRLEAEKQTALGLHAFARSGIAADGWELVVCGRGAEDRLLRELAAVLAIPVTFEGFVDRPRQVLASAGIVLATAPGEPFGLAVVEAMAESAPVVASDGGAHRQTVGENGALFPVGDVDAAAQLLRTLATDRARAEAYGRTLRTRQRDLFTIERHVDRLTEIYEGTRRR